LKNQREISIERQRLDKAARKPKPEQAKTALANMNTIFDCGGSTLPTLPSDILKKVEEAMNDTLIKVGPLDHRSFSKLKAGEWLNDEIINAYVELIRKRNKTDETCTRTLVFTTFIYSKLAEEIKERTYTYTTYKRIWERRLKIDINKVDQILFPINKNNVHWILCRVNVNKENPFIEVYDSLPSSNKMYIENIAKVVSILLNDAFKDYGIGKTWNWNTGACPIQENGNDCGVCVCSNMEFLSRGKRPQYAGKDTEYFRKKIAVELYKGELIPLTTSTS
jgi:sentrin-specific protease 1